MTNLAKRATVEWAKLAQEPISVDEIKGTLYAYGSEIACLRLAYEFRWSGDRAKMIKNQNKSIPFRFIFRLEPQCSIQFED